METSALFLFTIFKTITSNKRKRQCGLMDCNNHHISLGSKYYQFITSNFGNQHHLVIGIHIAQIPG